MKKWLLRAGVAAAVLFLVGMAAGIYAVSRFEPYVLGLAKDWLAQRFESEVQFESLGVSFPVQSPWRILLSLGKGGRMRIDGRGLQLRHQGRKDTPPLFAMRRFTCDLEIASLTQRPILIPKVTLEGMRISIPPKGERPSLTKGTKAGENHRARPGDQGRPAGKQPPAVLIGEIIANGTQLAMLPKDAWKDPLLFDIQKLRLTSAAPGRPMAYDAQLINAKPPGQIVSRGSFGPWNGSSPGESPLAGQYTFKDADLGVFKGIAGKLDSAGRFEGRLSYILVDGEAMVPNFSLDIANHPIRLSTKFHAIVDGTNGNTVLDPVEAQLGQSRFTCRGEIAKRQGDAGKRIILDVDMPDARLEDVLFLAMKGDRPFMRGPLRLKTLLEIPPGKESIGRRLKLEKGQFQILDAHFTSGGIQQKIDEFSRRGQGEPKDESVQEVPVRMKGAFHLANGSIRFPSLSFEIPGALLNLNGTFAFLADELDFLGEVRLDAKLSQLFSGWKSWVLKPVDPFFSKRGAGTYLPIQIKGSRSKPEFGLAKTKNVDRRLKGKS